MVMMNAPGDLSYAGVDCSTKQKQLKENKWGIFRVFFNIIYKAGNEKVEQLQQVVDQFQ